MCSIEEKRTIYVEDQESDECCSSKVNNIQRSGGDSSRLSVCSRQLQKKKKKNASRRKGPPIHIHTYRVDYDERKWICSFFFSLLLVYTYTTYMYIYGVYMHMSMRWKEEEKKKGEMFSSEATLVSKVIGGRARLLIAQKEQPTCMCVCDNDTVKINKTLYSH